MANKKISDFSAVKNADIDNMTAIAGVGTDNQDLANQNVKISGAELVSSLNIPTKTSDITNDSGFITSASIPTVPTLTSELTNDSGFITSAALPTVNNGELTITVDGADTTFTANEASNKSVSITTGGGGIDFSSLNINTIKANLSNSTQTQYGSAVTIKAAGAISNGDIIAYTYDSGEVKGGVASSLPSQNTIAGVAIEDIADGQTGKVLIYGYATVKYNNIILPSPAPNIALTSSLSGNVTTLQPGVVQPFSDSAGTSDYPNNQTFTYTFDSGSSSENVKITVNSFGFEGTSSSATDRLGFQESDSEGGPYVNCAFSPGPNTSSYNKGWRRMVQTVWQSGGGTTNDVVLGPYADGYVLPGNNSSGGFTLPQAFTSTKRYLKCFFYSDGSVVNDGWDIDVETTAIAGSPTNTAIGGVATLDINDLAAVTNILGTGRTIGISVGGTHANNSAVVFVEPPRVQ